MRREETLDDIAALLGKYTSEAMEIIDRETARRERILKSPEATSGEKKEALQSGIWYGEDYLVFLKPFKARLDWMLRKNLLKKGYMPTRLWERKSDYVFSWKESSESPSAAILDIVAGNSLYLLDCMTVFNVAQYYALLKIWGEEKFDRVFSGESEFTLPLYISHYRATNPIYLFLEREQASTDLSEIRIGDKIGIRNHPLYSLKHPCGAAPSWNIVCVEVDPQIKFVGFGFDGKRLTEREVKMLLIDNYNNRPLHQLFASLSAPSQWGLFGRASFPDTIDLHEFDASSTGYNFELIRLSAERVKMVMDMPLGSTNLLEVFAAIPANRQSYVMSSEIREAWDSELLGKEGLGLG